jgi:hypothetical protein
MTRQTLKLQPVVLATLLACGSLAAALVAPSAKAATITVDASSIDDDAAGAVSGCSLREAVLSVNAGGNRGNCTANVTEAYGTNDTILLPTGTYTLTIGGLDEQEATTPVTDPPTVTNAPDASVGDLDLIKSVKILGAGSGSTRIEWAASMPSSANTDRIFHIYNTETVANNVDVVIQGVTLAGGKTFQVDLGIAPPAVPSTGMLDRKYYLRRAGGALALGGAASVVLVDPNLTGAANASDGGLGGSTGGESGATTYTLQLSDVIVDGNSAEGDGGGLYIAAQTTATNVVLSNNASTTNGGGMYNEGNTVISNSTIKGNQSEGGGGMFATGSNTVSMRGTTFSGNTAVGGGAISSRSGVSINMLNSTISGNTGLDVGAGLYTNGNATLNFVTIAKNISAADSSTAGSGINVFPSSGGARTLILKNVLLEGNLRGTAGNIPANCGRTGSGITGASQGHNLSSDTTCNDVATVTWLDDTSDQNSLDPKIGALAANGGPTETHALLTGSPALGAGIATAGVTTDQRGTTRDATPDIGAYEEPAPVVPAPAAGGGGGGGCTATTAKAPFDPVLPLLAAMGLAGWAMRRRARRSH